VQRLEVSGAVRSLRGSLDVKGLRYEHRRRVFGKCVPRYCKVKRFEYEEKCKIRSFIICTLNYMALTGPNSGDTMGSTCCTKEKLLRSFGHSKSRHERINLYLYMYVETAEAQWLRCCATNQKVAGSIPDGVIVIFH
jgi:hypothetical protein